MHLLQAPRDESSTDLARYKPQDVGPIHHPKPQPAIAAADTAAVKETILARIKVSCMSCRWWFYPKPEMGGSQLEKWGNHQQNWFWWDENPSKRTMKPRMQSIEIGFHHEEIGMKIIENYENLCNLIQVERKYAWNLKPRLKLQTTIQGNYGSGGNPVAR